MRAVLVVRLILRGRGRGDLLGSAARVGGASVL
jgi:hypothetical protein